MKMIVSYDLNPGVTMIEMPVGSKVLSVMVRRVQPRLFVLQDQSEEKKEMRRFVAVKTGDDLPDEMGTFIGSFSHYSEDVNVSIHVFEIALEPKVAVC